MENSVLKPVTKDTYANFYYNTTAGNRAGDIKTIF